MNRRRILSLTASGFGAALAGCLGGGDDDSDGPSADDTDQNGDPESPFGGRFQATSQGGFFALGESTESEARANGYGLPAAEDGQQPVVVTADVSGDGSWESTAVDFRAIPIEDPIEGEITVTLPEGLSGEIDPEDGRMTASGELVATIVANDEELATISLDVAATTGDSGELSGSAAFDQEPARVTLVDNEFAVEESGNPLIDNFVGLPTPAGENWFELELTVAEA